jgi:hypothetical protein
MKRILLGLVLLLFSGCVNPPVHPKGHLPKLPPKIVAALHEKLDPPLDPEVFETFDSAAVYAIAKSYELTNAYESAGVIVVRNDMKFQVTVPRTESSGDSTSIPDFERKGFVVIADYHTHPCLPYTHWVRWFSGEDIEVAEGGPLEPAVIAIMGDLCTGNVNEWAFGVDPVGDVMKHNLDNSPVLLTKGHVIGHVEMNKLPVYQEGPDDRLPDHALIGIE